MQWSDTTEFWADTIRTVVLGVLGALAATFLLSRFSDSDKTVRDIRAQAVEKFLIDSNAYSSAVYDLCKNGGKDALARYESTLANYHGSRDTLTVYFDDDEFRSRVQDIEKKEEVLFAICKDGKVNEEKWVTLRNELKAANLNLARSAVKRNRPF
jgi:hypothetical protein